MSNISREGFSFHTFELQKSIKYDKYNIIKDAMYINAKSMKAKTFPSSDGVIKCEVWLNRGVTVYLHHNGDKQPHFRLVVNPRRCMDQNEYIGIFEYNLTNMSTAISVINEVLSDLHTDYSFFDMTLSRIDLCVNIEFENASTCNEYTRLIKKCLIPGVFIKDKYESDDSNIKEKREHSFRAKKYDITITIYDKIFQISEAGRLLPEREIPNGLLRIEVSLIRCAIIDIAHKYLKKDNTSNIELFELFGSKSKHIMEIFIRSFFPSGTYNRFDFICEYVTKIKAKKKIKKRMLYLNKKTSKCENLNTAIEKMRSKFDLSDYQSQYILNMFNKIDMNPVTLPNTSKTITLPELRSILEYEL